MMLSIELQNPHMSNSMTEVQKGKADSLSSSQSHFLKVKRANCASLHPFSTQLWTYLLFSLSFSNFIYLQLVFSA